MKTQISIETIKKLRDQTSAGVIDAKRALEETGGDFKKAVEILKERGLARAEKRSDRETAQGAIFSYIHAGGKIGVLLEVNCETDFVARTSEFQKLCQELAMQIAAMAPSDIEGLLAQEYIRDVSKKVGDLVSEVVAKTGENVVVRKFTRYELGESQNSNLKTPARLATRSVAGRQNHNSNFKS